MLEHSLTNLAQSTIHIINVVYITSDYFVIAMWYNSQVSYAQRPNISIYMFVYIAESKAHFTQNKYTYNFLSLSFWNCIIECKLMFVMHSVWSYTLQS